MLFLCISLLSFSSFRVFAAASVLPAHPHELHSDFPATWFHPESHPILTLFRHTRNGINISTDGNDYPPVGSSAWISAYPKASGSGPVDPETMPKAWKDFLETAIKEGKIPNIPQTTLVNGTPTYPNGTDPNSSQVCSAIPKNCKIDGDYWNAPIGHVALAFDDGPGLIFAELAFTMQIIHDSTGGRVPRIFRPPFGDTDMRVHSIAKVLGLTTIIWNQDTEDWHLASGGMTQAQISSKMRTWLAGPKSPGLVMLEHELSNETAQVFINNYRLIPGSDWDIVSAAQMDGLDAPYQNAKGTTGTAKPVVIVPNENNATSTSTSTPARWSQSTTSWARSSSKSTPGPSKSNKVNGVSRTPALGMPALSVVAVLTSGVVWLF